MTLPIPAAFGGKALSTGRVARLCGVSPRTVAKWCDAGTLKSYRIPQSAERRVERADLREFLASSGAPIPPALLADGLLVAVGLRADEFAQLPATWHAVGEFGLGALAATQPIAAAICGDAWGAANAVALARRVLELQPRAKVAVVLSEDVADAPGWTGPVVRRPAVWAAVARQLGGPA